MRTRSLEHRPADPPGAAPGLTVKVIQEQENNDGEPLIGDVQVVLTDEGTHPEGIFFRLHSEVTGRVKEISPCDS